MKHSIDRHLAAVCVVLGSQGVGAQPVSSVDGDEAAVEVSPAEHSVRMAPGLRAWTMPGPYEMQWTIAYNERPLTCDYPHFQVHLRIGQTPWDLIWHTDKPNPEQYPWTPVQSPDAALVEDPKTISVGQGEPVYAEPDQRNLGNTVEYELTKPDGTTVKSGVLLEICHLAYARSAVAPFMKGEDVVAIDGQIHRIFGDLEPGEHTLVVHMDSGIAIWDMKTQEVVDERFRVSTPELRFTVVEPEIPELTPAEGYPLVEDADGVTLTNPLDEAITVNYDAMQTLDESGNEPVTLGSVWMYNTSERLTHDGWVQSGQPGFCGTGMKKLTLQPGESVGVIIYSSFERGIIRDVITAHTASGEPVRFYTEPKMSEGLRKR